MSSVCTIASCRSPFFFSSYKPVIQQPLVLQRPRTAQLRIMVEGDPILEWMMGEGGATKILRTSPVGGGCINMATRYDTDAGSFFVKTNRIIGPSMFEGKAAGLSAMQSTNTIRVPKPLKVGRLSSESRGSFIIMEYIDMGSSAGKQAELGRQLAEMHKSGTSEKGFGFEVENTIALHK